MKFFYDTEFIEYPSTIDLISIGMVADDGREFYAISKEFNGSKADDWVKENVIEKLEDDLYLYEYRIDIANDLLSFIKPQENPVELYGYYSAYDHVALCWLFGSMIDLPKGMPMFTNDIKQIVNALGNPQLPANKNSHNALEDAKWTKDCYYFLEAIIEELND